MFFTIKNDFAIVCLRRKNRIFYLIKEIRYKIYGIQAKINGVSTFMNAHVPFDVMKNIGLHGYLISSEYFERMRIDCDTQEDIYYIKKAFKRSPAYEITQKCVKLYFLKEYAPSF